MHPSLKRLTRAKVAMYRVVDPFREEIDLKRKF